ncbi:phage/plasmid replication protein, II/X family, partial [Acinetobacter baumannii]
ILNTMKGKYMNFANDDQLLELFKSQLVTYTKTGKPSYTKAKNAMKFYSLMRQLGWKKTVDLYNKTTFHDALKHLLDCGISKSHLQNLA